MTQSEKVKRVAELLKLRFPNLTIIETIDLAFQIVEALDKEELYKL